MMSNEHIKGLRDAYMNVYEAIEFSKINDTEILKNLLLKRIGEIDYEID